MPTTLAIKAPRLSKGAAPSGSVRGFSRVAAVLLTVIDVFAEAQRQAADAERRYPFTVW